MSTVFPSSFPTYSEPPNDIKHYWIFKQGATTSKYKAPKAKERRDERRNELDKEERQQRRIDRMFEQMDRQREIQLMQSLNSMTVSSIPPLQQQPPPPLPPLSPLPPPPQYMQYPQYQQWPQWPMPPPHSSTPPNIYAPLPQHPHQQQQNPDQHHTAEPRPHKSSPLEDGEEKEEQAVDDFWTWRINKTNNPVSRQRLIDAKAICDEQAWRRLSDIQQLATTTSDIFKKAMERPMELPAILLRSFISSNIYIAWFIGLLTIYKAFKGGFRVSKQEVLCYSK